MTILLYKNGQWLIDGEQPLEGVSLDNLAAILTNPKDGDVVKYDEASGMWTSGKADALPPVTSSDNGKVLAVQDGAWAAQQKKFIVTLTPTALDYSGTMDKTVAEINAAYEAGQQIVFRIMMSSDTYVETPLTYCLYDGLDYPAFGTQAIEFSNDVLIIARIQSTDDGTKQTYSTTVYSLTPAS